jgi:Acetyltransferase (GNAT) domain
MRREAYVDFCASEPLLPIFLQPWYLDATCGVGKWDYANVAENGQMIAVWPYFVKKTWGINRITVPPFLRQCGPWISKEITDLDHKLQLIVQMAAQFPFVFRFVQDLNYTASDLISSTHLSDFTTKERFSYILDEIHKQDEVFFQIKKDYRKNKIPKAEKNYELTTDVPLSLFLSMQKATYKRQNLPQPASDAYISALDAALVTHHARQLLGARHRETGEIHAIAYLIADKNCAYLLAAVHLDQHKAMASGIFVQWHAILQSFTHFGVRQFDFLGSMVPKIESVRKQFGAHKKNYLRLERKKWWRLTS